MDPPCASPLHAILLPFPAQGHITPFLQLALKLLSGDLPFTRVTFINTSFDHDLIASNGHSQDLFAIPGLDLLNLPDGLAPDHGRLNDPRIVEFASAIDAMDDAVGKLVKELVSNSASGLSGPPVSCIIADIQLPWITEIATAVGVPWAAFWTIPIHGILAYSSVNNLRARGIVPVNGMSTESTQRLVNCIPGLVPLKAYELPSFMQTPDGSPEDFFFQWLLKRYNPSVSQKATWHLANTVSSLDADVTSVLEESMDTRFLTVGPLLPSEFFDGQMHTAPATDASFWATTEGCKEWLDKQEDGSVLYISFGSIVHLHRRQVEELAAGIEASGRPFLWVLRVDVDAATLAELDGFKERTKSRGLVVAWAPQLLVLSHPSVGAFLTHCGWNSILEAMSGGVPMLAWPGGFAEQLINARYIIDVWKIAVGFQKELAEEEEEEEGLLLVNKEEAKRVILEALDRESECGKALKERACVLKTKIRDAVLSAEGSSQVNLRKFATAVAEHGKH